MNDRKFVTPVVRAIHHINVTGSVIPHYWRGHITGNARGRGTDKSVFSRRPNLLAIHILADARYWHDFNVEESKDEARGYGERRRFNEVFWQQSYVTIAENMGCSERQVKDALDLLVEYGMVALLFHDVLLHGKDGTPYWAQNRMYILPIPDKIEQITTHKPDEWVIERTEAAWAAVPPPRGYHQIWGVGMIKFGKGVLPNLNRWYHQFWGGGIAKYGDYTEISIQRSLYRNSGTETPYDDASLGSEADTSLRSVSATRARAGGNANYPAPVLDGPDEGGDDEEDDDGDGVNVERIKVLQAYCLARMPDAFPGFDRAKAYVTALSLPELERCAKWIWFVALTAKEVEPGFLRTAVAGSEDPVLDGLLYERTNDDYRPGRDRRVKWEGWEKDVAEFEYGVGF